VSNCDHCGTDDIKTGVFCGCTVCKTRYIEMLKKQLADANAALRKYQGSVYMSAPDKWEFVADDYFAKYPEAKDPK
jgi:hypothetical protein